MIGCDQRLINLYFHIKHVPRTCIRRATSSRCKQPLSSLIDDKGEARDRWKINIESGGGGGVDLMSFVLDVKEKIALQAIKGQYFPTHKRITVGMEMFYKDDTGKSSVI